MLPSRKKKRTRSTLKLIVLCLSVFICAAAGYAGYLFYMADNALTQMSAAPSKNANSGFRPMSFLLAGVDNREGSGGSMNTDVLMLVTLNPVSHSATLVSIPRDLELKPKEYDLSSHKANYYYAYYYNQDQETAISKTKQLFSEMFQIPIDYMTVINFDGFQKVVDELGGIELNVDMDMHYVDEEDGTNIQLKKGIQTLNGKQTLDFLRYRKSNMGTEESSDTARNQRQQEALNQVFQKMGSFTGMTQWADLLKIAGQNIKTDIPSDELQRLLLSYNKLKPQSIDFIYLDGRWESPYMVVKEENLISALTALRKELDLPPLDISVTKSVYSDWAKRFGIDPVKKSD